MTRDRDAFAAELRADAGLLRNMAEALDRRAAELELLPHHRKIAGGLPYRPSPVIEPLDDDGPRGFRFIGSAHAPTFEHG